MAKHQQDIIADTIDYLVDHYEDQPDLAYLSERAGYDSTYFQKLFKSHVGISPKHLVRYMQVKKAEQLLQNGQSTLDTATQMGLSSTSRLHDLCVHFRALSPGSIKRRGEGITIHYGWYPSEIGKILVGRTDMGICWLSFLLDGKPDGALAEMQSRWPAARFEEDQRGFYVAENILAAWRGEAGEGGQLRLDIHGTNFQVQVWKALLKIPYGHLVSYNDIANSIEKPKANRAVGTAIGKNPVSLLIPCHRVIQSSGIIENYAWGTARKRLLVGMENG